jgi:hypothetical protein
VADKVQSALKKLQAGARRNSSSDGLGFATWNVPEDLATEDCIQIVLDGVAMRTMQQAKRSLGVEVAELARKPTALIGSRNMGFRRQSPEAYRAVRGPCLTNV